MTEPTPYERVKNCDHEWLNYVGGTHRSCNKCGQIEIPQCNHDNVKVCSNGHSECHDCGFVFSLSHQEAMKVDAERDRKLDAFIGILTNYCKEHPDVIEKFFTKSK